MTDDVVEDLAVIEKDVYNLQPGADDIDSKVTTLRFSTRGDAKECSLDIKTNAPTWLLDGMFEQDVFNAGEIDMKRITLKSDFSGSSALDMDIISEETLCKLHDKVTRESVATARTEAEKAVGDYTGSVRAAKKSKAELEAEADEVANKLAKFAWSFAKGVNSVVTSDKRSDEERALLTKLLQCVATFVTSTYDSGRDSSTDIKDFVTYLLTSNDKDAAKAFFSEDGAPLSVQDNKADKTFSVIRMTAKALDVAMGNYLALVKKMALGTCKAAAADNRFKLEPLISVTLTSTCGMPITVQQVKPAPAADAS